MTEKSLKEEVTELERFYNGEAVRANLAVGETTRRLIADWRARGERIQRFERAEAYWVSRRNELSAENATLCAQVARLERERDARDQKAGSGQEG